MPRRKPKRKPPRGARRNAEGSLTRAWRSLPKRTILGVLGVAVAAVTVLSGLGVRVVDVTLLSFKRDDRLVLQALLPFPDASLPPREQRDKILALAGSDVWDNAARCSLQTYLPEVNLKLWLTNTSDEPIAVTRIHLLFDTRPVTEYIDHRFEFGELSPIYLEPHREIAFDFMLIPWAVHAGVVAKEFKLPYYPPFYEDTYTPYSALSIDGGVFPPLKAGGVLTEIQLLVVLTDSQGRAFRTVIAMGAAEQSYWMHSIPEIKPGRFGRPDSIDGKGGNSWWLPNSYEATNSYWGNFSCP